MPAHGRFVATDDPCCLSLCELFDSDLLLQESCVAVIAECALRHVYLSVASKLQLFDSCSLIFSGSQSVAQIAIQTVVSLLGRFERGETAQWR